MADTPATLPALAPWAPSPDLAWLPNAESPGPLATVATGVDWDAVRVPAQIARPAIAALDHLREPGALLCDPGAPDGGLYYWFVPSGYGAGVAAGLSGVRPLGTGAVLVVAAANVTGGERTHWRRPPLPGQWITSPAALRTALASAVGVELAPMRVLPSFGRLLPAQVRGLACIWCERSVDPDAVPYPSQPLRTSGGPARWYPRACPECAR
jgi:hypothetical protein